MKRLWTFAGIAVVLLSCMPAGATTIDQCMKRVSDKYAPLKTHATLAQEQAFQAELLRCESPGLTKNKARCLGAATYDYSRLAALLEEKKISPAQYLQRLNDRRHKSNKCSDSTWSADFVRGDSDHDLVPDAVDHCPGTGELLPTDDSGCPVAEASQDKGPSPQDVARLMNYKVFAGNPNCANAPVPTVPAVLEIASLGFPTISPPKLRSEFRKVVNQPAKCPVVYQVRLEQVMPVHLLAPGDPAPYPQHLSLLLRPKDAVNVGDATAKDFVFESLHSRLVVLFHWGATAKIRAINGSGSVSPWSQSFPVGRR